MVTDRIKAQFHIFVYCLTKHSVIIMRILSKNEEIANTWTHAAGILLGVVIGTIFIVMNVRGGDAWSGTPIWFKEQGTPAQVGPCRHLLAHSRQLFPYHPHGTPRLRFVGHRYVHIHLGSSHRRFDSKLCTPEGAQLS